MCRRRYSHLASVDAIVGDLEVGGRPGLFVVEPVSEHDDLYGVGQECHDKGLQSGRDVRVVSFAEQSEWSLKREKPDSRRGWRGWRGFGQRDRIGDRGRWQSWTF